MNVLFITLAVLAVIIVYKAIKNNWSLVVKWAGITALVALGAYVYVNQGSDVIDWVEPRIEAFRAWCASTQSMIVGWFTK